MLGANAPSPSGELIGSGVRVVVVAALEAPACSGSGALGAAPLSELVVPGRGVVAAIELSADACSGSGLTALAADELNPSAGSGLATLASVALLGKMGLMGAEE